MNKATKYAVWTWIIAWTLTLLYFTLAIRTYGFGATPIRGYPAIIGCLTGISAIALTPFFIAYRPAKISAMRYIGLILLVGSFAFLMAESYATLEEHLFMRECSTISNTQGTVFTQRWWPFQHHYIGYHPQTGKYFGGD